MLYSSATILFLCIVVRRGEIRGYYWRDYTGTIPEDAFRGGTDSTGNGVYIGQTVFEDKLIPGYIKETDSTKLYFEWYDSEKSATKHVKILCTQEPEKMEWLQTKHDEVHLLTNRHFVLGGFEGTHTYYIGRANVDGDTLLGKVVTWGATTLGLYVTKDGMPHNYLTFEILTFNEQQSG